VESSTDYTTVRIKKKDRKRISSVINELKRKNEIGNYSTDDVITLALNSLEVKQQETSFVTAKEVLI
jgi:hypothetical protein